MKVTWRTNSLRPTTILRLLAFCLNFSEIVCQPFMLNEEQKAALKLPNTEVLPQKLRPHSSQVYSFTVGLGGNMSITVFPCQGSMRWNITYVGAQIFTHPHYPSGRRRKKRCCTTAAVTFNFNFHIPGLNAGLGTSLGGGAITFFQEDSSGGTYYLRLANYGLTMADYEIFATLRPDRSPYVALPNDPQTKVTAITSNSLSLSWMPISPEPWRFKYVTYCVVYHPSASDLEDDVHSSTCARHRARFTSYHAGCSQDTTRLLQHLEPSTQYDIDVYARNLITNTETAYLSVTASTAAPPFEVLSSTERWSTLLPLHSQVLTLRMRQTNNVHVAVSPCQGHLRWSILDADGRQIRQFRPDVSTSEHRGGLRRASDAGVGISLGRTEMEYRDSRDGTYRVMVQNVARTPATYQLYASRTEHNPYPKLPLNSQVRVVETTWSSIVVEWKPSADQRNVIYCVHHYPHEQAERMGVVHSGCGLEEAAKRRVITRGDCSSSTRRTLRGLRAKLWYDVDVVAKNTFTRKAKAYTSVRAITRPASATRVSSSSSPVTNSYSLLLFALLPLSCL